MLHLLLLRLRLRLRRQLTQQLLRQMASFRRVAGVELAAQTRSVFP